MITRIAYLNGNRHAIHGDGEYDDALEIYGLSTDEKPTLDIHNADIFYEMDTKRVFLFDEANSVWLEQ